MHFTCRSFLAPGADGFWSQYWENEPDDPALLFNRGHLFGLINLTSDDPSQPLSRLGRQLISDIDSSYFAASSDSTSPHNLSQIVNSLIHDPQYQSCQINLNITVIQNHKLFLYSLGNVKTILKRRENISILLSGENHVPASLSGPLELNDRIFLTTNQFFSQISWEKIKTNLASSSLSVLEEDFLSDLYSQSNTFSLAAALIQINPDDELSPEIPLPPPPVLPRPPSPDPLPPPPISSPFRGKSDIYVSPLEIVQVNRRKKINLVLAFIILLGLAFSSFFGYRKNQSVKAETRYQSIKSEVQKKINTAQSVKNLSLESALSTAKEAEALNQQLRALNLHSDEVTSLDQQIKTLLSLTGDSSNSPAEYFYDTSLVNNSPQYRFLKVNQGRLYLLDNVNGRLDSVGIREHTKENHLIDPILKDISNFAFDKDTPYVISSGKLYSISLGKLNLRTDLLIDQDPLIPQNYDFWNGSLYVLDTAKSAIWKFTPTANTFGTASNWLKTSSLPDNTTSFAINGKIWVLSSSGKITPYNRGENETFNLQPQNNIKSASRLITSANSEYLAFIDDGSMVYVYKKNGETVGVFSLGDKKILDLVLEEDSSVLYLLCTDEKIYKLAL